MAAPSYIAILRGINVSGQKKVRMEDLRKSLAQFNFQNLQTYIQSGNVVFSTEEEDTDILSAQIHDAIQRDFGFDVPVIVLSKTDLKKVSENNPFVNKRKEDINRLYVTFLAYQPQKYQLEQLADINTGDEEFIPAAKAIYLFCPKGYGRAKLNNNFIENKLKVTATTRNWKTVKKLLDLA